MTRPPATDYALTLICAIVTAASLAVAAAAALCLVGFNLPPCCTRRWRCSAQQVHAGVLALCNAALLGCWPPPPLLLRTKPVGRSFKRQHQRVCCSPDACVQCAAQAVLGFSAKLSEWSRVHLFCDVFAPESGQARVTSCAVSLSHDPVASPHTSSRPPSSGPYRCTSAAEARLPPALPPAVRLYVRPANAAFHSVAGGHLGGSLTPLRLSPLLLPRYDRQRNRCLGRVSRLLLRLLLLLLQEVRAAQVWGRASSNCVCTVLHLRYADARMRRASCKQTSLPPALARRDNADDASSLAVRGDGGGGKISPSQVELQALPDGTGGSASP